MIDKNYLLKTWASHAIVYKWLHDRSGKSLFRKKLFISVPLLILNTVGGVLVYKADSFMTTDKRLLIFECTVGTINMLCVLLSGLKDYFGFGEKSELHVQYFQNWAKFKNEIYVELSIPSMKDNEFLTQMKVRYVDLISYGPSIPNEIIDIYVKKFGKDIENSQLPLPDIIYGGGLKIINEKHCIDLDEVSDIV
tara:strand:+ start:725 stop:1306 length:582 start_codon:yes stop_codon:yes gene_type:complete